MRQTIATLIIAITLAFAGAGFAFEDLSYLNVKTSRHVLVTKEGGKWKIVQVSIDRPTWKPGHEILLLMSHTIEPAWERVPGKYGNGSWNCPVFNTRQDYYWPCDSELTDTMYAYEGRGTIVVRKAIDQVLVDIDLASVLGGDPGGDADSRRAAVMAYFAKADQTEFERRRVAAEEFDKRFGGKRKGRAAGGDPTKSFGWQKMQNDTRVMQVLTDICSTGGTRFGAAQAQGRCQAASYHGITNLGFDCVQCSGKLLAGSIEYQILQGSIISGKMTTADGYTITDTGGRMTVVDPSTNYSVAFVGDKIIGANLPSQAQRQLTSVISGRGVQATSSAIFGLLNVMFEKSGLMPERFAASVMSDPAALEKMLDKTMYELPAAAPTAKKKKGKKS